MLLDIKAYLMQKQSANLQEIAAHFKLQPDVLRPMLDHWIRKGHLVCRRQENPCGSPCGSCQTGCQERFYWENRI